MFLILWNNDASRAIRAVAGALFPRSIALVIIPGARVWLFPSYPSELPITWGMAVTHAVSEGKWYRPQSVLRLYLAFELPRRDLDDSGTVVMA